MKYAPWKHLENLVFTLMSGIAYFAEIKSSIQFLWDTHYTEALFKGFTLRKKKQTKKNVCYKWSLGHNI